MADRYLIVGLGNPGAAYARTRHNAGFMLLELLAHRWHAEWKDAKKFQARLARAVRAAHQVVLCEPQTYMNLSGEAVGAVLRFYQLPHQHVVVVVDDADLPLGQVRLRPAGSSGGHHGLESIEAHLGTRAYPRLRIGIGRQDGRREITGHVLGKLSAAERRVMEKVLDHAASQIECWLEHGLQKAMSQFNGVVDAGNEGNTQ